MLIHHFHHVDLVRSRNGNQYMSHATQKLFVSPHSIMIPGEAHCPHASCLS